jgi:predicted component of type VI protein secretion system
MANTFSLVMQSGPTPGLEVTLELRSLLLGRDPQADIVINDPEVSRSHARLIAGREGYTIEDLGSTNGTFINEQRVSVAAPLNPGDAVRLGDMVVLIYKAQAADEAQTMGFPARQPSAESAGDSMEPASLAVEAPPPPPVETAVDAAAIAPPTEELPSAPGRPRRRERRKGLRLPLFTQPWMTVVALVALLGACAAIFFLWYIDVNFLWCDLFGGVIPACR